MYVSEGEKQSKAISSIAQWHARFQLNLMNNIQFQLSKTQAQTQIQIQIHIGQDTCVRLIAPSRDAPAAMPLYR